MAGLNHGLALAKDSNQRARERFTSALRAYTLVDLAAQMRSDYDSAAADAGVSHRRGEDVHAFLKSRDLFKWYSSLRCTAQELVWQSTLRAIQSDTGTLAGASQASDAGSSQGSLELNPDLPLPAYTEEMDVHLMPGNYQGQGPEAGLTPGAVYDNGLEVFSFGVMGEGLDDIGHSMANFARLRWPDMPVTTVVDVGCTIGHNTLPWKQAFPDAEVYGLDIAAPCLRYGHARAEALGIPIHFRQAGCDRLPFADASVDVVFSSMFLHELPVDMIRAFFNEAFRVLRPGGLLIHMELPPNDALAPYDAFYLDWDCFYNNEPFYKGFRDLSYPKLCSDAGFSEADFFQATLPRFTYVDEQTFAAAIGESASFDEDTGRLSDTITWYAFGSRKQAQDS